MLRHARTWRLLSKPSAGALVDRAMPGYVIHPGDILALGAGVKALSFLRLEILARLFND